ncbi:uncharacterized protein M6B38_210525 [Iris pallida]|uniref:Uncharacterized protein n=1 Tax=Iris pallida TaxID=29817 RepID=A0AAX6E3T5_IRIPA|nr:uncharacterized protein M6B38_210525 [Iris pallida]
MAPNNHRHRHEIELETNGGLARGGSNHETGPTVESMPSEPRHDSDSGSRPPWFVRFARWVRQPVNLMLFLWLIPVVGCLLLMLLLMTGALNGAIDGKERRKKWLEDTNQVANALFTVGCLYTHPEVFYHLLFVVRWRPEDQEQVRSVYCSGRRPDPRDRKHLLVVTILINLTWVGQYIMCVLYWVFNRHNRPGGVLDFWVVITLLAPVAAWLYASKGPLKSNKTEEEAAQDARAAEESSRLRFCSGGAAVAGPQWDGGPFDCCDDSGVCLSAFLCTFCAFGRNMSRLGFGSRNMHAVTFLIAVVSPLAVFAVTAIKVESGALKAVVVVTGAVLSWVGMLYGGYWRVKMRERFGLPENELCFGRPFLTDYFLWLFCGPCALAQEVRTADNYDVEEGHGEVMVPLPRGGEGGNGRRLESNRSSSAPPKTEPNGRLGNGHDASEPGFRQSSTHSKAADAAMAPPQRPWM